MAEEVSAEILRLMRANFMHRVNTDAEVRAFLKKLREKKATQGDVSLYSVRLGELLREVVRDVLTAAELPNETLYYNIMQDTVGELLKDAHRAVNDAGAEAQRAIDEQNGVGLAPISADFPQRRVNDLFYKAGAPGTTRDRALKILYEPLVTLTQSFHDDHVRVNAEARYRAGMAPKIVRTASFGCCKWCASLEGSYPYEDVADTGNDVFRRHERCKCTVDYVCDGKVKNVWKPKRERPADAETLAARRAYGADEQTDAGTLEARRAYGKESERAKPEEIEAAADRAREEKSLAFRLESGIISNEGMYRASGNKGVFAVLPIRMSRKTIREIAKEFDIDVKHLSFTIDRNEELLGLLYTGRADPEKIGGITFFPNAFTSKEELVRTLYHERIHVYQFRQYGAEYVQNHREEFEEAAYREENAFIERLRKEGKF